MAFVHSAYLGKMIVSIEMLDRDPEYVAAIKIAPDNTGGWRSVGEQSIWLTADDLARLREALVPERDPQDDHLPTAQDEADWMDMLMS